MSRMRRIWIDSDEGTDEDIGSGFADNEMDSSSDGIVRSDHDSLEGRNSCSSMEAVG